MRKRWKRSLPKKLLCFSTAIMMIAVILMSSIPVKAASVREYIEFFNTGKIYRSVNTTLYQYNSITKTLTLKGGTINCYEMCFLESNVKGLRINVEKDTTIYDGYICLNGDTTITGPGKLTIAPTTDHTKLSVAISIVGYNLTLDHANLDITASAFLGELFGSKAISAGGFGERLVIRESQISAKAGKAAISGFNGGILTSFCNVISPFVTKQKNGSIYQSDGKTLAKEVMIAAFYYKQQLNTRTFQR